MHRIFIAVKVSPDATFKSQINSLKRDTAKEKIKWVETSNMHITLFFLGNTEKAVIKVIKKSLKESYKGLSRFNLIIKGFGVFKSIRDPRVIWAGVVTSEELNNLQNMTVNGLRNAGISIDDYKYSPHVTLGRIKLLSKPEIVTAALERFRNVEFQKINIEDVIIYESVLSQAGPTYVPLAVIPLD